MFSIYMCGTIAALCFVAQVSSNLIARSSSAPLACTPTTNASTICNVKGFVDFNGFPEDYNPARINITQLTSTFEECRDVCKRRSQSPMVVVKAGSSASCVSFAYDMTTGLCLFNNRKLAGQNFRADSRSSLAWSSESCFKCQLNSCPSTPGVNLLDNGGFESSSKYIGPWQAVAGVSSGAADLTFPLGYYNITTPGYSSPSALTAVLYQDPDIARMNLAQDFTPCPGTFYIVSYNHKIDYSGPSSLLPNHLLYIGGTGDRMFGSSNTNGAWVQMKYFWHATADYVPGLVQEMSIFTARGAGTTTVHVDNVSIVPTSGDFPALPGAPNLLANGDFETGVLAPWVQLYADYRAQKKIVSPGLGGSNYAYKYTQRANVGGTTELGHNFTAVPGTTYVLSITYKTYMCEGIYVQIGYEGPKEFVGLVGTLPYRAMARTEPAQTKYAFVAMKEALQLRLYVDLGASASPSYVILDDISIREMAPMDS